MNLTGAIDFHVHFFPPEWGANPLQFAQAHREPYWGQLMMPPKGRSLQGWVTEAELLKKMDDAGLEKIVLQGWYWQQFETCRLHNRCMAQLMEQHPDRIEAFASLLPTEDGRDLDELNWALDRGFCGVGELHPAVQGFSLIGAAWGKIMEQVGHPQLPFLFHVTEPVGRDYQPRMDTDFRELQQFIETHPDHPVILAHWGGLVFAHLLNPAIRKRWSHVYFDTAATPLLYDMEVVKLALQLVPPERILYGSDFPLKVYPSDPDQPEFSRFLQALKKAVERTHKNDWATLSRENAAELLKKQKVSKDS